MDRVRQRNDSLCLCYYDHAYSGLQITELKTSAEHINVTFSAYGHIKNIPESLFPQPDWCYHFDI